MAGVPGGIMTISKELLEILACPVCKEEVHLTADETGAGEPSSSSKEPPEW